MTEPTTQDTDELRRLLDGFHSRPLPLVVMAFGDFRLSGFGSRALLRNLTALEDLLVASMEIEFDRARLRDQIEKRIYRLLRELRARGWQP
jgi:hypothetical protein